MLAAHATAQDVILLVLLGGILGAVGQGMRVIVGLKKLYDQILQEGKNFGEAFNGSLLGLSLLIGAVAGALGMLGVVGIDGATKGVGKEQIMTLIGIGYAGSDFIEGFVKKYVPQTQAAALLSPVPAVTAGELGEPPAMG